MTQREQAYLQGFIEKCAQHGVDPELMAKEAGFWGDMADRGTEAFDFFTLGARPAAANFLGTLAGGGSWGDSFNAAGQGFANTYGFGDEAKKQKSINDPNSNIDPRAAAATAKFRAAQQAKQQPTTQAPYAQQPGAYQWGNSQLKSPYATSNNYYQSNSRFTS